MTRDHAQVGIARHKRLKDSILLLIGGLQGYAVLHIALAMIALVAPQMIGFDAQQHINIGQAQGAEVPRLLPCPQ